MKVSCLGKVLRSGARLGDGVASCNRGVGGLEGRGSWKEAGRKVVGWVSAPPQGWFEPPRGDEVVREKDTAGVAGVL